MLKRTIYFFGHQINIQRPCKKKHYHTEHKKIRIEKISTLSILANTNPNIGEVFTDITWEIYLFIIS